MSIWQNMVFWNAIIACLLAQVLKTIIELFRTKSLNAALFYSTGGMPSSHSALVTSLSMSVGLAEGFDTTVFAVSAVLAGVVMYDAAGVRRAAGKQAAILNKLLYTHYSEEEFQEKLKELLGHTPLEVFVGALLGLGVALLF